MNDISREIGVSKKTLYEIFTNKTEIVEEVIRKIIQDVHDENEKILNQDLDVFEKLFSIYRYLIRKFRNFSPAFIYDLKKYYSDTYSLIKEFRDTEMLFLITETIKQGKKEEYFMEETDEEIIYRLHVHKINILINQEIFPNNRRLEPEKIFDLIINNIRGITTLKGHKLLDEKIKNKKLFFQM